MMKETIEITTMRTIMYKKRLMAYPTIDPASLRARWSAPRAAQRAAAREGVRLLHQVELLGMERGHLLETVAPDPEPPDGSRAGC